MLIPFLVSTLALVAAPAPLTVADYATMPALSSVRFSPDGRRIAYVLNRADLERSVYDSDVWLIDADGRNNVQLTRGSKSDHSPEWSPDGRSLAFLSDRDGTTALYVINAAGGEAARLTDSKTAIRAYAWSPDGRSIAYTRLDDRTPEEERRTAQRDDARVVGEDGRHAHLHVIEVESRKSRRLTGGDMTVWTFGWSP
ncbi:MAG TPA: DPP IV N-terminal domain-containing protein, partial [Thermoanaerobaculia bacterium]|nr:DPP IV N-terminal domain-containing protein [Thermoanaerobaculia bacterium]